MYLAVPADAYKDFFGLGFTQAAIKTYQIRLIVYDTLTKEIVQWIS
ncbi:MAG: element excision factor XisH family protein [Cyanobacteria bacterium P01_F01_bin.150]